jgi:predicted nucleic acid-binding protein
MTVIDTSAWIEALRRDGDEAVRERVRQALFSGEARFAPLVLLELWNGARGDSEKKSLREFEKFVPTLACDEGVWKLATKLAQKARAAGITAPAADLLIAATALRHKAGLLHNDAHLDALAQLAGEGV